MSEQTLPTVLERWLWRLFVVGTLAFVVWWYGSLFFGIELSAMGALGLCALLLAILGGWWLLRRDRERAFAERAQQLERTLWEPRDPT